MDSFSTTKLQKLESNRNRPSRKQQYLTSLEKYQKSKKVKKNIEPSLSIYAELSKKAYNQILNDEMEVCLPNGVKMANRAGSRGLFFQCQDLEAKTELIMGLDASGISWQEN
jgi:hypothetical protein